MFNDNEDFLIPMSEVHTWVETIVRYVIIISRHIFFYWDQMEFDPNSKSQGGLITSTVIQYIIQKDEY